MDRLGIDDASRHSEQLSYFNYFTEVEEEFVRRRGKPLLISPMDWALVESWKSAGIPLHVVLRAINRAFDAYDARARKYRKVNSVFYCQQEVESTYAEYRLAQVGAAAESGEEKSTSPARKPPAGKKEIPPFPKDLLLDFIARSNDELARALAFSTASGRPAVEDAITRAQARLAEITIEVEGSLSVDAEAIERDLDAIDRIILESALKTCGEAEMKAIRDEAESQLHPYRNKMDKALYNQTIENFVRRRLREMNQVPRLSLFYI